MSGLHNSATFQKSGTPLVINAAGSYSLKRVSRAITVSTSGGEGTIAFDGDATAFSIPANSVVRFEVAILGFTLGGNATAVVELTGISSNSLGDGVLDVNRDNLL